MAGTVAVALPSRAVPATCVIGPCDLNLSPLKPGAVPADLEGMAVDTRFLEHWRRQQTARRRARAALPARWRNDPRPEMRQVTDVYVELLVAEHRGNVVPLALEDR